MRRKVWFLIAAAWALAAGLAFLGYRSWPVTGLVSRLLSSKLAQRGWSLTTANARWIPLKSLTLEDLKVRTPLGGKAHVGRITVTSSAVSVLRGGLTLRLAMEELRIDPGSWGIRKPLAQEILSTGPVATTLDALLRIRLAQVVVQRLSLRGPLIRLSAQGSLFRGRGVDLALEGDLARVVLEGMDLVGSDTQAPAPWEAFELRFRQGLGRPELSFNSNFLKVSFTPHADTPGSS